MTNNETIKTFRAGKPVVLVSGSGMPCSLLVALQRTGRVTVIRTGAATIYTLRSN